MIEKSAKLEQMISFDSHSSPAQFIASIIRNPFFLLLFFASYGPSINIVGQLRVTEIILLLIGAFYIRDISRSVRRNEVFFAAIFVFTAMCYVFF